MRHSNWIRRRIGERKLSYFGISAVVLSRRKGGKTNYYSMQCKDSYSITKSYSLTFFVFPPALSSPFRFVELSVAISFFALTPVTRHDSSSAILSFGIVLNSSPSNRRGSLRIASYVAVDFCVSGSANDLFDVDEHLRVAYCRLRPSR